MSKVGPTALTAILSGAALVGYLSYRLLTADSGASGEGRDAAASSSARTTIELADELPDFALANLEGSPQSIRSWPGKPLLINFWATWCGPCLREIPMLKDFQSTHEDFQVVGIATLDKRELVEAFAQKMQFNYPVLMDENSWEAASAFGVDVHALPFTVFAGPEGHVLGVHTGELHAEQLANLTAVLAELKNGQIGVREARLRLAGRM
jgi:thiol-disulfide isomerase/thioredoxin